MDSDLVQYIVLRKDLNMRKGKMVSQGCHASVRTVVANSGNPKVQRWLDNELSTKITVSVDSEEELLALHDAVGKEGIICSLVTDAGKTEFGGIPTKTCLAIGPDHREILSRFTQNLKLL